MDHKQGYRLIGAGLSQLHPDTLADRTPDLLDPMAAQRATVERARDEIRKKIWKRCNYQGPQPAVIYSAANGNSGAPNRAIPSNA